MAEQPNDNDARSEDIRAGYQAALQLVAYEGALSWQVTNIFITLAFVLIASASAPLFTVTAKLTYKAF